MPDTKQDAEPKVVIGSREQLLHLLAEASEIEHTLMCSYLYAASSLKRKGESDLSEAEGKAVERWRKSIMSVAIEEMGHLLMVANLTVAVGGRPHFGRPNFPVSPGYFPSGVVVRLSGFSAETLDHFIYLERPRGVQGDDADDYEQQHYARDHARPGLMPSAQDYTTIGHLYEAIRLNLDALTKTLGERQLFLGGSVGQVGGNIVELAGLATINGFGDAVAAINLIVEQGEGSPADRDESHFRSFLSIRDELDSLTKARPSFAPAWPVATNPVLRQPPDPDDKVFINSTDGAELLDFTCAAYGLLLRLLVQAFGREGAAAAADQSKLMEAAFELMHVVGGASSALARLPANDEHDGINAGMSFTMLRSVEPFLGGLTEWRLIREQLNCLADAAVGREFTRSLQALAERMEIPR